VGSRSHGGTGAAYLVLGPISADQDLSDAHAKLVGEPGSSAGESISGAGDVNLDGFDDLIVGAAYRQADEDCEGAAYLVLGPVTGELELIEADARIYGEQFSGFLGFAVDSAGDVDGDGFGDIIVSANEHGLTQPDGAGATYLFLTPGL
jgi:hypothetical protein